MLREEKIKLTSIGKITEFKSVLEKLTTNLELTYNERSYLLSISILFLNKYQKDRRLTSYVDFAYYIILKYSLTTNDYQPLYDLSLNLGFYPIVKSILNHQLINETSINNSIIDTSLNSYKNSDNYIETLEQHLRSKEFLLDSSNEKCYLAPTSFGKSSLIVKTILELENENLKIVIIVPTKSLLMQTFKLIIGAKLGRKIIMHDEMYNDENNFIAVFTQERALRLMNRKKITYDVLFIDEAHNILKGDSRSILLSRLISRNRNQNPDQKIIYLSPLIEDINNLRVSQEQSINSYVINQNIKEPEIFEFRLNGQIHKYNRFVNQYYPIGVEENHLKYILRFSRNKNFLYNYRPIKIEQLAKELTSILPTINDNQEIKEIQNILTKEVHSKFYAIKYLKYGVIYLHGKLPDIIKEYLEYKFKEISDLKYVIANAVILEGMNLPIDNLFILNTRGLKGKELMNLIGRVNRLNFIFTESSNNLNKLTPPIHFLNNEEYNGENSKMGNKIELLRSTCFVDNVENPTLESYDIEKLTNNKKNDESYLLKIEAIQSNEDFLINGEDNETNLLKKYLIESGIVDHYSNIDSLIISIKSKIRALKINKIIKEINSWNSYSMLEKINNFFIDDIDDIINDHEVSRLSKEEARKYYENFMLYGRKKSLNENVVSQLEFFKQKALSEQPKFYFGGSYGEVALEDGGNNKIYVNLHGQSDEKLINLAIVKLKMEEDFVSFKLNKFIVMLFDYDLISKNDYNLYIYGTTDENKIALTKYGLNISLISRLAKDQQLHNLSFDKFNNLVANDKFKAFLRGVDDFYRFEVSRYLN